MDTMGVRSRQIFHYFSVKLHGFLRLFCQALVQRLAKLATAQKLYLLALFGLFYYEHHPALTTLLTISALIIESWPLCARLWLSLAGKMITLIFYAIIVNFSLASSSSVVNEVTGVSTTHFNYTHNFALLLELPTWIVIISCIALLLLQMLLPVYIVGLILLKLVGFTDTKWRIKYAYPVSTALVRLMLSFLVLYHLMLLVDIDQFIDNHFRVNEQGASFSFNGQFEPIVDDRFVSDSSELKDELAAYTRVTTGYHLWIRQLVADFAFGMEADSRTRCKKATIAHGVELNDYELLQISPDPNANYGYRFEVIPCISVVFPQPCAETAVDKNNNVEGVVKSPSNKVP